MDLLGVNIVGLAAIFVTITVGILAGLVFVLGSERVHYIWGIFCISICIWSTALFIVIESNTQDSARFWWKIAYIGIIMMAPLFFHFTSEFVKKVRVVVVVLAYVIGLAFVFIDLTTNLVVNRLTPIFGFYFDAPPSQATSYLLTYYLIVVVTAHVMLYRAYRRSKDERFREQIAYFFLATGVGFIGGGLNFAPIYGWDVNPITIVAVIFGASLITYAVLRYNLFNIRVAVAQLLTLLLAGFALFYLMLSKSLGELVVNCLLFSVSLGIGMFLIRSVMREVDATETLKKDRESLAKANTKLDQSNSELKDLSQHLQQKVDEQTAQIRESYEVEKKARIALQQLTQNKDRFILAAQRQLTAPVSLIRDDLTSLLQTPDEEMAEKAKPILSKADTASSELSSLVNHLLDISEMQVRGKKVSESEY